MNETQTEPQKPNREKRHGLNFKRSAVEHWLGIGKSVGQVAAELGINAQTLKIGSSKWPFSHGQQHAAHKVRARVRELTAKFPLPY